MKNRLITNPLIEENMNQMVDGEFSVNQIKGHVTIKKENEYISKTKEFTSDIIDINLINDDLTKKIQNDIESLDDLENKLKEVQDKSTEIDERTEVLEESYEITSKRASELEAEFDNLYKQLEGLLVEKQKEYSAAMDESYDILGEALVASEFLDVILQSKSYFDSFINNTWNYEDSEGNIKNYNTKTLHETNKTNFKKLVNTSTYNNAVSNIQKNYSTKPRPWLYTTTLGSTSKSSSISYNIK